MKITFPHFGNTYIPTKILFDALGIEYIIPPINNKETLEIGTLHSPEEICLPFKMLIGNYIQSINKGADTVVLVGSSGPCRFGEYSEMQMHILKDLGYNLDFIVLDTPKELGKELFSRIMKISKCSPRTTKEKYKALYTAYKAVKLIDEIEAKALYLNGYEVNKGDCKRILNECKKNVVKTNDPKEAINILNKYKDKINNVAIDKNKKPVKVAIIGEIYTVIEPSANVYIQDKLMDYGVSVKRELTMSWWLKDLFLKPFKLNSLNIRKASKEYLPYYIGGHAKECIGEAILAKNNNFDGAIQVFPMGCMPEIVSKTILQSVSKDKDFPVMTLIIEEMTGEVGYITRIEAFLDLLERRREYVLLGS